LEYFQTHKLILAGFVINDLEKQDVNSILEQLEIPMNSKQENIKKKFLKNYYFIQT
jgi:hypothetical protein